MAIVQIDGRMAVSALAPKIAERSASVSRAFSEVVVSTMRDSATLGNPGITEMASTAQPDNSSVRYTPPPGFATLGYGGQNPPLYPPGYPESMKKLVGQVLNNPNISMATKNAAWAFAVMGPTFNSAFSKPDFSAPEFLNTMISATSLNSAYADLNAALRGIDLISDQTSGNVD